MLKIKQNEFPYRNHIPKINYNLKELKIETIKPLKKFDKLHKPKGLWYGIRHHWADFESNKTSFVNKFSQKVYKINNLFKLILKKDAFTDINNPNKNKILVLKKISEFDKFTNKYYQNKIGIRWSDVMKDYGGIEIPKLIYNLHNFHLTDVKKDYSDIRNWYYGWDVPSGIIWNNKVSHKIIKIL